MLDRVPVVDLRDFLATRNPDAPDAPDAQARRAAFIAVLGEGLERFGFVAVTGHGIAPELLAQAYQLAEQTFALPESVKRQYETPHDGRQRGFTSFGVEHAKDHPVGDLKEFWHVGRELGAEHALHLSGDVPPNQFPKELPAFQDTFLGLFNALEGFANQLLSAVGLYLGRDEAFFSRLTHDGNSVLRIIHYPSLGEQLPEGAIRAAAHEDINLLTVLPVSTKPGLELLTRDGEWMAVEVPPDTMVCDTGDMMQLLTGRRLPATTHRVVNPRGGGQDGARLSMPFFLHPHPDAMLTPMSGDAAAVLTRDFFHQRLREIGVES